MVGAQRERKVRPVVKVKRGRGIQSGTVFCLEPAVMSPPPVRNSGDCKTEDKLVCASCHPEQETGGTTGREQIKFPLGKTGVAERKTEKNGREGRKAGLAASSKY